MAALHGWGKDERRGVLQAFNLAILAAAAVAHAASGLLTAELGWRHYWLGARAYCRLSNQRFHEVVLSLLGVSGLTLVWGSL